MNYFLFSIIGFAIGVIFALVFVKSGKSLKHKKEVGRLELEIDKSNVDKSNLQVRNNNLAEAINQHKQSDIEIKRDIADLSRQVMLCLELASSVTKIQEQAKDIIDAEIIITQRCYKKYERYLSN